MNNPANTQQVATTILSQLGGGRFMAMTGAQPTGYSANSLSVRFKGSKMANHLKVVLEPNDTYTMIFGKIRGMNYTEQEPIGGVYNDMLQRIFTEKTGLYTRL